MVKLCIDKHCDTLTTLDNIFEICGYYIMDIKNASLISTITINPPYHEVKSWSFQSS